LVHGVHFVASRLVKVGERIYINKKPEYIRNLMHNAEVGAIVSVFTYELFILSSSIK
jgi:hypothetical protein